MSSEALAWAFKQNCKSSSVKFTLVALCECANYRTGRITPSIDHICEITGQNRKTVIGNIAELEAQGIIKDTGERVGRTKQIKVYQTVTETVPETERSQERNSTEKSPKQSQKRDTEPSREPSNKHTETRGRLIADDWRPAEFGSGSKSAAIVASWDREYHETTIEHFIAHHQAKRTMAADWQPWWKTWVLNSRKFGAGNGRRDQDFRQHRQQNDDRRSSLTKACDEALDHLGRG